MFKDSKIAAGAETKNRAVIIAIDAMGGDKAPEAVIAGANIIAEDSASFPNLHLKIHGHKQKIEGLVQKFPKLVEISDIIHCEQAIPANEKAGSAIRNFRQSSMYLAVQSVKEKQSHAVVSAGNTAALMAISTITLRTLNEIHRPAIITLLPSIKGKIAVVDLGANTECDANNLYQFAVMGHAFAKIILGLESPKIGLLNIGSEETKGKDSVRLAKAMIQDSAIAKDFYGYIEGNDLALGTVDVAVTDGFTGNAILKVIGGYGGVYKHLIKEAISSSVISKIKYLFFRSEFKKISNSLDSRYYNGAMLIGLNGIVVKSHGSMDEIGIANAIKVAYNLSKFDINMQIKEELHSVGEESVPESAECAE